MTKVRCDPVECCGQWHEWPEKSPCPKCGRLDTVVVWEAWSHPNGELYCEACLGFDSNKPFSEYWTWHVKDGEVVIYDWIQEPVAVSGTGPDAITTRCWRGPEEE